MFKSFFALFIVVFGSVVVFGQQVTEKKPGQPRQPQGPAGFISPADVNVQIEADVRTIVVMAAVNVAGMATEPGGQPLSPARAELVKDLGGIDPKLKADLAAFYRSHRRAGTDEIVDGLRYEALS